MFIRSHTTLVQIFCELSHDSQVIFKSIVLYMFVVYATVNKDTTTIRVASNCDCERVKTKLL